MDMNDPRMRAYRERLNQINEMKRDVADYIRKVAQEVKRRVDTGYMRQSINETAGRMAGRTASMNQNTQRRAARGNYQITCNKCGARFNFKYDGADIPWISDCPVCHAHNNDKATYQISAVDQYA